MYYGDVKYEEKEIPEAFVDYFRSVYSDHNVEYNVKCLLRNSEVCMSNLVLFNIGTVDKSDIIDDFNDLKNKQSSGPDGIPTDFLKHLKDELIKPLMYIF